MSAPSNWPRYRDETTVNVELVEVGQRGPLVDENNDDIGQRDPLVDGNNDEIGQRDPLVDGNNDEVRNEGELRDNREQLFLVSTGGCKYGTDPYAPKEQVGVYSSPSVKACVCCTLTHENFQKSGEAYDSSVDVFASALVAVVIWCRPALVVTTVTNARKFRFPPGIPENLVSQSVLIEFSRKNMLVVLIAT